MRELEQGWLSRSPGSVEPESPPNWSTLELEITCPRCGYNLYMLTTNLCPECGHVFSWAVEIERAKLNCSPIFEVQIRNAPIASYLRTTLWLLLPWRFWRRLPSGQTPLLGVLFLQLALTILLCLIVLVFSDYAGFWIVKLVRQLVRLHYPWDWQLIWEIKRLVLLLVFVVLSWIGLCLFWQTRRTYQLDQKHLAQITIYSAHALLLSFAFSLSSMGLVLTVGVTARWWYWHELTYISSLLALLIFFAALARGLCRHMPAPLACRMAAVVIAFACFGLLYIAIVSGLIYDSFEYSNPVATLIESVVPPLWLLQP